MAKEDVADIPAVPPRKRRALEATPDVWLAIWATDESLSDQDRKRAQDQRDERKRKNPDKVIGLLVERQGVTPEQLTGLAVTLAKVGGTAILQTYVPAKVNAVSKRTGIPVTIIHDQQEIVKGADVVVACPRGSDPQAAGVADMIRYAKHRNTPVLIIAPDWRDE